MLPPSRPSARAAGAPHPRPSLLDQAQQLEPGQRCADLARREADLVREAARGDAREEAAAALWASFTQDAPIAPLCFKRDSLLVRAGAVTNLSPTRADPFRQMEEWVTALQ